MKIAKLVILLTAVSFIAIGVSCVLISSIVIANDASVAPEMAVIRHTRDASIAEYNRAFNETMETWETANPEGTAEARELHAAPHRLTRDTNIRVANELFETQRVALREDRRDALTGAFTHERTHHGALAGTTTSQISPMGAVMITGVVFTLAGIAVMTTMLIINKKEAKA